ncbi:hypothetical protein [Sphingomonas sp.]|uniref:hypothetical protein n=1 Tax=Sphingomonas sp. TaxID=28214 RepID=UPI0025D11269|nr:hypothetical protein [Sphingomonas sp.]
MTEGPAGDHDRSRRIAMAGWLIILVAGGAAALPALSPAQGAIVIGSMLVLSGLIEVVAGTQRKQTRKLAMLAGVFTIFAGLLFTTDQATKFAPTLLIIAGWLFLRSVTLAAACALEHGSVQFWTGLAAGVDFLLAFLLAVGFSAATLVLSLFGATPQMIAQFAWVLAVSFLTTGAMLLEVAKCARRKGA